MIINFKNIEDIVFYDQSVKKKMPEFTHLFDQWKLSQQIYGLKTLAKRSVFEFLNSLEEKHIKILSEHFGVDVQIEKIDHRLVVNTDIDLKAEDDQFCKYFGYSNFCITNTDKGSFITFWR
jgi:hypothetical protein